MAGDLQIGGTQTGTPSSPSGTGRILGQFLIPMGSRDQTTDLFYASGFNAIVAPAGSQGVILIPAADQVATVTLKGITGDTGVVLSKVNITVLTWDTPPSFGLTFSGAFVADPYTLAYF